MFKGCEWSILKLESRFDDTFTWLLCPLGFVCRKPRKTAPFLLPQIRGFGKRQG